MKLLQHPAVAKVMADPRTMDLFVAVVRTKEQLGDALAEARRRLAGLAGLVTAQEVADLKVVIRDLERMVRRGANQ